MLRRAVELQPNNADAMTKLADLYLLASTQDKNHQAEALKESKELVDKLLKLDPQSYDGASHPRANGAVESQIRRTPSRNSRSRIR